jgi:alpha-L-fucosidase
VPTRREVLEQLFAAALAAPVLPLSPSALVGLAADSLARPTPAQLAWQDLELGMFIHFAPNTWQDKEYDDRSLPPSAIMPTVETEQWAQTAQALGAGYIVLVAKHVGGFCLWQTDTTDYGIRNTPWRGGHGDVVADLAASCASRGLGLGIYLSPRDDNFGAGLSGRCPTPERQAAYNDLYRRQLTELLTRYGPIVEVWLDGSSVVPTGDLLSRYAPDAMVFQGPQATIRWVGNEQGFAPYPCWNAIAAADARTGIATALHGDPDGDVWMPVEVDVSIRRPNWFWSTTDEKNLMSLDDLIETYYRSVGHGAQLLLNLPPDRTGRIPAPDVERAREFGGEIRRRFATPVGETAGADKETILSFGEPRRVDHLLLQESLAHGELVRGYRVDGFAWGKWRPVAEGTSIGHKRIQPIPPDGYAMLRLTINESRGQPVIRRFAAYNTGVAPPPTWNAAPALWADDAVGTWSGESVDLDLTARLQVAGQYRIRFVPEGEMGITLRDFTLSVDGVAQHGIARPGSGRRDVMVLTLPRVGGRITVRARLRGAARGTVLLQRF